MYMFVCGYLESMVFQNRHRVATPEDNYFPSPVAWRPRRYIIYRRVATPTINDRIIKRRRIDYPSSEHGDLEENIDCGGRDTFLDSKHQEISHLD